MKEYLNFALIILEEEFGSRKLDSKEPVNIKKLLIDIGIYFVLFTILCFNEDGIFGGLWMMLLLIAVIEMLYFPCFIMRRKNKEEAERKYRNIIDVVSVLLIIAIIVFLILCLFNAQLHFWW